MLNLRAKSSKPPAKGNGPLFLQVKIFHSLVTRVTTVPLFATPAGRVSAIRRARRNVGTSARREFAHVHF